MRVTPLLLVATLALAGCSSKDGGSTASGPPKPEVLPATAMEVRALAAAPGARATVVNIWATWCAPCREEFPALLKVAADNRERGLRLVLVSADFEDSLAAVRKFLSAQGVRDTTWLMSGDQQTFINTMATEWSGSLPATFVYDARGQRVAFWEGMGDEARFRSAVDQALAASGPQEDSRR